VLKKIALPLVIFLVTQVPVQYWILFHINLGPEAGFKYPYFASIAPKIVKALFLPDGYAQSLGYPTLFNPILSVIFFISILLVFKKEGRNETIFLWSLFLIYFFVYSFFAQSYEQALNASDYVRFIQMLILPYSLLAGAVLVNISDILKIRLDYVLILVLAVSLISTLPYFQFSLFKDSRADKPLYQSLYFDAVNKTPNNCTIITSHYIIPNSDVFENNKRRTVNIWLIFNNTKQIYLDEFSEAKCLIFLEDWFCKTSDNKIRDSEPCKFLYDNLNLKYLYNITKNNMVVTLYNATTKQM
jgi:hypothetical protein